MARKGIVVGGAGGIGQAIVEAAIQAGDEVIVLDRGPGSCGHFVACDQSDPASVEKAFAAIDEAFAGPLPTGWSRPRLSVAVTAYWMPIRRRSSNCSR
ncbi:NAD-dependent epimerase/dehydratase family protein [Novosphingobium sp. THN1]|uniref:NAD-dependent epimerase/dehydratase family protein n=1 Tax=Novosphingobium sp. THN1 TaxID=1016987 RepID=UPI000E479DB8